MARTERERWTPAKKEIWITSGAVTLPFILFLVFLAFMTSLVVSSENLQLENAVERAFSDVLVALQQGEESVPVAMHDRNVLGFGYYTHTGSPIYTWGNAYRILPFSAFNDNSGLSDTMISFNKDTGVIECMRYAESITFDLDNIFQRNGGLLEMPDIIYLAFDASSFVEQVALLRVISGCCIAAVVFVYFIIMKVLRDNRKIRESIRKQENLVSLGEAARTLTHEIKNPLSAITIQLAILKREVRPEVLPDVMIIDQEAERLRKLTDRVSEFLRNPLGQPEKVDLIAEIHSLIPLFHGNVHIKENMLDEAFILFDRDKLRSVLENLMKNAVEACDGMTVDVEAEVRADDRRQYHVYIRDRGCGIRNEDQKRIFDPFFTTKINGSGIGLAISSQFIKAAGGKLRLYQRDGGGTVAEAILPAYRGA